MATTKEEPLHLKQGSKVYSKLLSKESSLSAPSFRVYYGVASAGSVPFLWESQPGTPKNSISTTTLPPLTPPPSYYIAKDTHKITSKKCKSNIFTFIMPKITLRRAGSNSSTSCSSSSSSSFRSIQSPMCSSLQRDRRTFSIGGDEEEMMTCFKVRSESYRAFKGCGVAMTVKSVLASVSRHGSRQDTSA